MTDSSRRPHGEPAIKLRSDGRYWVRLELPSVGGPRRRQPIYGRTAAEVVENVRQFWMAYRPESRPGEPIATADLLDRWLTSCDQRRPTRARPEGIVPSTWISYEGHVRLHLAPYIGEIDARQLAVVDVEACMEALARDGRSPALRAKVLTTLRIALNWAKDRDFVERNVASVAIAPKVRRPQVEEISLAEIGAILDAVRAHRLGTLFTLAETLGPRLGELTALKWDEDFDELNHTLTINHTLSWATGVVDRKETKTERSRRTIALPQTLFEALLEHRARQCAERLAAGSAWVDDGYIFTRRNGRPLRGDGTGGVGDQFKRCLRRAGLTVHRFHQLRHNAASMLLMLNGGNLVEVQYLLGHSTYRMTADLYGHLVQEAGQALATKVDHFLRSRAA